MKLSTVASRAGNKPVFPTERIYSDAMTAENNVNITERRTVLIHSFLLTVCYPYSRAEEIRAKRSSLPEAHTEKARLEVRPGSPGCSIYSPKRLCTLKAELYHMRFFKSGEGGRWRDRQTDRQAVPFSASIPLASQC